MINAMENNEKNTRVQRKGCFALKALLHEEQKDIYIFEASTWAKPAVDGGCIERVIAAMNNHRDDASLQMHGCECFSRLSKTHVDYRNAVIQANGLGPVGQAVHFHKDNEQVKRAARNAFNDISA